jgi:glycosyltransferase involved in cell wall biosynthesis
MPSDKNIDSRWRQYYADIMQQTIKALTASGETVFLLNHEGRADRQICCQINTLLDTPLEIIEPGSALDVKAIIGHSKLVVCSRYHGCVSALSQNIPCIGTSWSHKYQQLFAEYDVSRWLLTATMSKQTINALIRNAIKQHQTTSNALAPKSNQFKTQSEQMWQQLAATIKPIQSPRQTAMATTDGSNQTHSKPKASRYGNNSRQQSMTNNPLVTIYIPTKDRLTLLQRAVKSVLAQSYPNIELIIVDDGSRDGTVNYLQQLSKQHSNIRFFVNPHSSGACVSRNTAIMAAQGELVSGLDDDDEFSPERIATLVAAYDDKYAFITSAQWCDHGKRKALIDPRQREISFSDQLHNNDATNQVLVNRQKIIDAGLFDTRFPGCQDWDMWTRLTQLYGTGLKLASPTYITHQGHQAPRLTLSDRRIEGYQLFYQKYGEFMSKEDHQAFRLKLKLSKKKNSNSAKPSTCSALKTTGQ